MKNKIDKTLSKQEQTNINDELTIVGVGSSAGGLEALQDFFDNITPQANMAYVCIQHLSPDYKSLMVELLSKRSDMHFVEAENDLPITGGTVYMIPRNYNMTVEKGVLKLAKKVKDNYLNFTIDIFFESLAIEKASQAIAVILSGTGSDGSRGALAIHLAGGTVLVQSPDQAKFNGMPVAAIDLGIVDYTLNVAEIPKVVDNICNAIGEVDPPRGLYVSGREKEYFQILELLYNAFEVDFKRYKLPTILRRLNKRMTLVKKITLPSYLQYLSDQLEEQKKLHSDLLIGVTTFFRDEEAYSELRNNIFPKVLVPNKENETVKIWSVGCSKGHEAYSIAMMADQYLSDHNIQLNIKIFATDCNRDSIDFASAGIYSKADVIGSISPAMLEKYFTEQDGLYTATVALRNRVVFSQHNVTSDPPFHKVDLLVCRNVMIYFKQTTQKEVLHAFQYSLKLNGYLFLGPSESLMELKDSFEEINRKWKIFKNTNIRRRIRLPGISQSSGITSTAVTHDPTSVTGHQFTLPTKIIESSFLQYLAQSDAACIITSSTYEIIEAIGAYTNFTEPQPNRFTTNLLKLVSTDLDIALRSGVKKTSKSNKPFQQEVRVDIAGVSKEIVLTSSFLKTKKGSDDGSLMFVFQDKGAALVKEGNIKPFEGKPIEDNRYLLAEEELKELREDLALTIQEVETFNEALQATNEELLSSNEELQSTNEELQSVNEELHTVNSEFQLKNLDLTILNNDLDHLMESSDIGTLFLDKDLRIRRYTDQIFPLINVRPSDVGRFMYELKPNFSERQFLSDIDKVLDKGIKIDRELQIKNGDFYLARLVPYIAKGSKNPSGIVATFFNITERVESEELIKSANVELKRFAYVSSHDLKSPVNNIIALLQIISKKKWIDPQGQEVFNNVILSAQRAEETLLTLNKVVDIKRGAKMDLDVVDINTEIKAVVDSISEMVSDTKTTIKFTDLRDKKCEFPKTYFQSVIQNLITNAIKYKATSRNAIIDISASSNDDTITINVSDNGAGINLKDNGEKLFQIFQRLDTREIEGKGIGLHLVKSMMDRYEGAISVNSTVDKGTDFKLVFKKHIQ